VGTQIEDVILPHEDVTLQPTLFLWDLPGGRGDNGGRDHFIYQPDETRNKEIGRRAELAAHEYFKARVPGYDPARHWVSGLRLEALGDLGKAGIDDGAGGPTTSCTYLCSAAPSLLSPMGLRSVTWVSLLARAVPFRRI
jgi:hypothetical protein